MTKAATLVTVLRHGEVAGPADVLRGKVDAPLSAAGLQQMQQIFAAISTPAFTQIVSSPLARCRTFAESAAATGKLPLTLHAGFEEIDFGDWEGLTPSQAQTASFQFHFDEMELESAELFSRFQLNPEGLAPPNGEAFNLFCQRVLDAFAACLTHAEGGHTLIVTHAGVMRVILSKVLGLTWSSAYQIAIPTAGSFQLSLLPGHTPYLLSLNRGQPCAA